MDTNRNATRRLTLWVAMLAGLAAGPLPGSALAEPPHRHHSRCADGAEPFTRIDLYFGLSRPGGVITEEEFKAFVDVRITPRFPEGLTLLTGIGQFRSASGTTVVEGSKVLILLVPGRDKQADAKVEAIRDDYRHQFQQESVLRSNLATCASF